MRTKRKSKVKRNSKKKVIQKSKPSQIVQFIQHTMDFLATIKMFHWTTEFFSIHKATDELYGKLQTFMDHYVEASIGHYNESLKNKVKSIQITNLQTTEKLNNYTIRYKNTLRKIRDNLTEEKESELINILDDMLTELDVLLYLLKLK